MKNITPLISCACALSFLLLPGCDQALMAPIDEQRPAGSAGRSLDPDPAGSTESTVDETGADETGSGHVVPEPATPGTDEPVVESPAPDLAPLPELIGATLAIDDNPDLTVVEITLVASVNELTFFSGSPAEMWTFGDSMPGPTIQARVGDRIIVHFTNDLPDATTIHWHGMRVPNDMDGSPLVQDPILPGETFTYDFIAPDAGTYWYHPHMMTHMQVERGLYGAFIVHEAEPPIFDGERIIFLDDIRLDEDGTRADFTMGHPDRMHGRHGNVLLLNGVPVDEDGTVELVPGAIERWRILNSANAREAVIDLDGAAWRVIATDGGLIPEPYTTEYLMVAPGERYDIEVVWAPKSLSHQGKLRYWVPTVQGDAMVYAPFTLLTLTPSDDIPMGSHTIELPEVVLPVWPVSELPTLEVELDGVLGADQKIKWMLNGEVYGEHTPVEVELGSYHTIDITNKAGQVHPLHIHGHFFQVISRNGAPVHEPGLKDTVRVGGNEVVRIVIYFDNPGNWMYHCHILEHAKQGMMGVIEVW